MSDEEKRVIAVFAELTPQQLEDMEKAFKESLENFGVPEETYIKNSQPDMADGEEVVTSSDIDKNIWGSDNEWYFKDETDCGVGPFETRGQAIDAMLEYHKKMEEEG